MSVPSKIEDVEVKAIRDARGVVHGRILPVFSGRVEWQWGAGLSVASPPQLLNTPPSPGPIIPFEIRGTKAGRCAARVAFLPPYRDMNVFATVQPMAWPMRAPATTSDAQWYCRLSSRSHEGRGGVGHNRDFIEGLVVFVKGG
jgi:hypothetical protein